MKKRYLFLFIFVLCCLFLFTNPKRSHSVFYGETEELSKEEIEALDRELIKALNFYYNKQFSLALPIFRRIAEKYETQDLMYWIGRSASKTSDYKLAEEKLKKLLDSKPNLHQARLELALVYLNSGKYKAAKLELEQVRAANPPAHILDSIDRYMELIENKIKKFTWDLRFTQSYQYDDNITSGPAESRIEDSIFAIELTDDKQKKQSSNNWLTDLNSDLIYDLGDSGSFLWNGGINLYYSHSFSDSDFNYMNTNVFTGPMLAVSHNFFKLPVGFSLKQYGGDSLSNTFHIDPSMEHFFTNSFSLKVDYTYAIEDYSNDEYAEAGYDNSSHLISVIPNFILGNRRHNLSGKLTYEIHDADVEEQSYSAHHFSLSYFTRLSYFKRFQSAPELLLFYEFMGKKYDGVLSMYSADRDDKRNTFVIVIGQNFLEKYFASLEFAYFNNSSNYDLCDFNKMTLTLTGGVKF